MLEFVAKARSDGMRGVVVVPFTPSDPTSPALAAALLTSVDGQRDPCIVLSDPAAYVRVGGDLGSAQRLAFMAVDFGLWSQRTSVGSRRRAAGMQSAGSGSRSRASCTPRTASASRRRSCGLAGRAADASARGKTGASEGRLKTLVTRVLTRCARSHHHGWHDTAPGEKGGLFRPLGLGWDGYVGASPAGRSPVPW